MPRPPRPLLDGGCYHLIARGNNRHREFVNLEGPYAPLIDHALLEAHF